jgi:hypothetical protein
MSVATAASGVERRSRDPFRHQIRRVVLLAPPTFRSLRWAGLVAGAVVAVPTAMLMSGGHSSDGPISAMRMAAGAIALGAAFLLDDPTEDLLAHVPTSLLLRRVERIAIALPAIAATWLLADLLVPHSARSPLPFGAMSLELAALVAAALALSATAGRAVPEGMGGVAAAPLLLALVTGAIALPKGHRLFISGPWEEQWHAAHGRWRWVLGAAIVVFVWQSLDPGRPRAWARFRALGALRMRGGPRSP